MRLILGGRSQGGSQFIDGRGRRLQGCDDRAKRNSLAAGSEGDLTNGVEVRTTGSSGLVPFFGCNRGTSSYIVFPYTEQVGDVCWGLGGGSKVRVEIAGMAESTGRCVERGGERELPFLFGLQPGPVIM